MTRRLNALDILRAQTHRIIQANRTVENISVEVSATLETDGIFAEEPPVCRIVVSGAIVIKAGFGVPFASGIAERVRDAAFDAVIFPKES